MLLCGMGLYARLRYRYPTTTVITTDTLDKLARALNVDVSLLIESDPPLPKTVEAGHVEE